MPHISLVVKLPCVLLSLIKFLVLFTNVICASVHKYTLGMTQKNSCQSLMATGTYTRTASGCQCPLQVIPHLIKHGKRKTTTHGIKVIINVILQKQFQIYICFIHNNFCCHKFTCISPTSRTLTGFYVQMILNEFFPDIVLLCIVDIALSHQCQFQGIIRNCDNFICEKLYRIFNINNIISNSIRHYCNFYFLLTLISV